MSELEFILTGLSMVLALAVAKLLDGFYHSLRRGGAYWVASVWFVNRIQTAVLQFWGYREWLDGDQAFGLEHFLCALLPVLLLYMNALALAGDSPGKVEDWRRHFEEVRVRFFVLGALLAASFALVVAVFEIGGTDPIRFVVPFVLNVAGAATRSAPFQAVIAVLFGVTTTAAFAVPIAAAL